MNFGNGTTPGQGTCPYTSQMHGLSQPTPKFAGLSFFSAAIASDSKTSLDLPGITFYIFKCIGIYGFHTILGK